MPNPPGTFPRALVPRAHTTRVAGDVPVLLTHPEEGWSEEGAAPTPAPVCLWFHGRTVSKELDPGRYLRWARAGIAACAVDLPGHGERRRDGWDRSDHTLMIAEQAEGEVDAVLGALREARFNGAFDTSRVAIGGMSAGGMVALIRLCGAHPFACAVLEATAGDWSPMRDRPFYVAERVERLEPARRLSGWRPIPLLALHSEGDELIPVEAQRSFIEALRARYAEAGADPEMARLVTWERTDAPQEHMGFGAVTNEAKTMQTDFLRAHLMK